MTKNFFSLWTVAFLLVAGCAPISGNSVPSPATGAGQPVALIAGSLAAGQPQQEGDETSAKATQPAGQAQAHTHATQVDLTHLLIGDGHVSTQPEVGSVWSCQTSFNSSGAFNSGSWMNGDGTFDLTAKPTIDGSVTWPSSFTLSLQADSRVIAGNDLPNHPTGNYPVSQSDDAYAYDRNPNRIRAQAFSYSLPANPSASAQAHCLPGGPIGVLLSGSYIFNALDAAGRDAVAHELQDNCQGHPERSGSYHYHNLSTCIDDQGAGHSNLLGYAFDGFGLYGSRGENGEPLADADLDACHGHTHTIEWDGQMVEMYHYHATAEYPYTLGCFHGESVGSGPSQQNGGQPAGNGQRPPQIDLAAAAGKLGVSEEALRAALGDPSQGRPDLAAAASQLGVTEQELAAALGLPAGGPAPDAGGQPPQQAP
jgi:hypothetical protein